MILRRRIVGGLWPFGLLLPWYLYTVNLSNMKFGGSDPTFSKEFTRCNYIIKHYTIGCCGLCGQKVKVWVDKCIVMGAPRFDQDMAERDAQADSANPNELNQRFANQSASGAQTMSVQVPPGLQGGMPMQVHTPNGLMQLQIPPGLQPGMAFVIQVPQPTTVELTGVSLTSSNEGDLERGGGAPAAEGSVVQAQPAVQTRTSKADAKAEEKAAKAAAKRAAAATKAEEKAAAAAATESAAQEAAAKTASAQQATAQEALAAKLAEEQSVSGQVFPWLTERCGINASDAKLYADALADLGIDTPEDVHMIDGDEIAWPSVVKLVHRKKIVAGLESSRKMPLGRKMSDTI